MKQTKNMREIAAMLDEMSPEQLQLLRSKSKRSIGEH
jgi:hypothetical protein